MSLSINQLGTTDCVETSLEELFAQASAEEMLALVRGIEKHKPGFILDLLKELSSLEAKPVA